MSVVKDKHLAVFFLFAVLAGFCDTSFSQNEPQSNSSCKHCFNAKRYPVCCSYWVIDMGLGVYTTSYDNPNSSDNSFYSYLMGYSDIGYMINLNKKSSIGGTFFGAVDEDRARAGVRIRYRRWLTDKVTLDLSPGILLFGEYSGARPKGPGFITTAHVSFNSRINGFAGMELFRVRQDLYSNNAWESTETSFFVGAGVGQEGGIVGYGILAGLLVLFIAGGGVGN